MLSLLKKPSAWIPLALSFVMLSIMVFLFLTAGPPVPQKDEGTAAHLFQIWLVLEALFIAFFGIKWLLEKPMDALLVVAIQLIAVFIVCFPVFYFHL